MRNIQCPNCHKDEFQIITINGVKVKQCTICGGIYQLAEKEVDADYLPDSKDADGNFVKCPKCGCPNIKKTEDVDVFTDFYWLDLLLVPRKFNALPPGHFICLNRKCNFVWKPPLF